MDYNFALYLYSLTWIYAIKCPSYSKTKYEIMEFPPQLNKYFLFLPLEIGCDRGDSPPGKLVAQVMRSRKYTNEI